MGDQTTSVTLETFIKKADFQVTFI